MAFVDILFATPYAGFEVNRGMSIVLGRIPACTGDIMCTVENRFSPDFFI
jgi:hypothetical protein